MELGPRDERRHALEEFQRSHDEMSGAIAVRGSELEDHLTGRGAVQVFLPQGRTRDVAAQPFELLALRGPQRVSAKPEGWNLQFPPSVSSSSWHPHGSTPCCASGNPQYIEVGIFFAYVNNKINVHGQRVDNIRFYEVGKHGGVMLYLCVKRAARKGIFPYRIRP